MITTAVEFAMGQGELILFCRLLQAPTVPGLGSDPLEGLSKEQSDAMLVTALHSLKARGWVQEPTTGELALDPVVVAMLATCILPDLTFRVTLKEPSGRFASRFYHINFEPGMIVEHSFPDTALHRFETLPSRDSLSQRVAAFMQLDMHQQTALHGGQVAQSVLATVREQVEQGNPATATALLQEAGLTDAAAADFVQCLQQPRSNASLLRVEHGPERVGEKKEGFATLKGSAHIWLMIPEEAEQDDPLFRLEPLQGDGHAWVASLVTR